MRFEEFNLNKPLLNALDNLGFKEATTIQEKVFPVMMSGADVCGIAQTGTGKTIAFLLPLLRQWKFSKDKNPTILILVPTRELVVQVVETVKKLSSYTSLKVAGVYGGVNINTQKIELEEGMDIVVATPGRFYDLVMAAAIKTASIKKLVIDEVDELLNLGFRRQLTNIMELLPAKRQNLLLSATLTEDVEKLVNEYFFNTRKVEAAPAGSPVENISQSAFEVPNFYTKINLLIHLLRDATVMSKVLVFVAGKQMADQVFLEMDKQFPGEAGVIHSNKEQNHRFNTVKNFKEAVYRFIIATDIVARGIDVAEVSHVINFDLPSVPEDYVHRIGRTGRADKKGIAISFITEKEKAHLPAIQSLMNMEIPVKSMPQEVELSTELTEDERPKVYVKEIQVKIPKREAAGPSFHEKSAKNQKVNKKLSRKDKMMKKYGKPISRGAKRK